MFPATWDPNSTHNKKKRKTFLEHTDTMADQSVPVEFSSDLQNTIVRKLSSDYPPPTSIDISMDHILSNVSYKKILENLFGNLDPSIPDVPILSKSYEESYMRQAMTGEKQCIMGDQCECMYIDKTSQFVGVEFRLPNDPDTTQMCLLCSRAATQKCFYDMCFLGKSMSGIIQRFGNIFGQPGEYSGECMLMCPRNIPLNSMPIPCMSHQRNKYSVLNHGGVKCLKQHRVGYEDFPNPSS